jgi:cytochrome b561
MVWAEGTVGKPGRIRFTSFELFQPIHDVTRRRGSCAVLLALVAIHMPAAIWHHFIRRDGVVTRMIRTRFDQANHGVI